MDKISSRWRPLKGPYTKKRRAQRLNYAKLRERRAALKMQSEKEALIKQEFVSENQSDYTNENGVLSMTTDDIDLKAEKLFNVTEEFANTTLMTEEVFMKEEILEDSLIEATESNIANDFLLPGSDPSSADPLFNQIKQDCSLNQETGVAPNSNNILIGIDDSLKNELAVEVFPLESGGSRTLLVFKKLQGLVSEKPPNLVPIVVPEKIPDLVPIMRECKKCGKSIPVREMVEHLRDCGITHSSCEYCSFSTPHESLLQIHTKTMHLNTDLEKIYVCDKCPYKTARKSLLQKHHKETHPAIKVEKFYECTECKSTFKLKSQLNYHINRVHYFCRKKKKSYHSGKYVKICPKCNIPTEPHEVLSHCIKCNTSYNYQCKNCKQIFRYYSELSNHLIQQCLQGYYECTHCAFRSGYNWRVRFHMLKYHRQVGIKVNFYNIEWKDFPKNANGVLIRNHACSKCGITFGNIQSFNVHARACSEVRGVSESDSKNKGSWKEMLLFCEKCNTSTNLDRYPLFPRQPVCTVCQTRSKFKCTQCDGLQKRRENAIKHLTLNCQSQRKRYICDFCEKTFQHKNNLRQHIESEMKRHILNSNRQIRLTLEQKNKIKKISDLFSCRKCDAMFAKNSDLTRHLTRCDDKLQMPCMVLLTRLK